MARITELAPQRAYDDPAARDWFWRIVDASRGTNEEPDEAAQLARLRGALDALSDQDLVEFVGLYWAVHAALYTWRLWAAGYLMNGGCSDDGFIDFRAWLIAQGRPVAEGASADPDSLAELGIEMEEASFEEFGHVMLEAFQARSDGSYPTFGAGVDAGEPEDHGWHFDFDNEVEMRRRLPRLAALYL